MFLNRDDAGQKLARALSMYRRERGALVLALPRGGVVVGSALSFALDLPLDVFISMKLRMPESQELAFGAVTETGHTLIYQNVHEAIPIPQDYLEKELHSRKMEIQWRTMLYRGGRPLPALKGRTIILVDDGVATGATFTAALQALKPLGPKRLIAALPVGPLSALETIEAMVDELEVLLVPRDFSSVGSYYANFDPVTDAVVLGMLSFRHQAPGSRRRPGSIPAKSLPASNA